MEISTDMKVLMSAHAAEDLCKPDKPDAGSQRPKTRVDRCDLLVDAQADRQLATLDSSGGGADHELACRLQPPAHSAPMVAAQCATRSNVQPGPADSGGRIERCSALLAAPMEAVGGVGTDASACNLVHCDGKHKSGCLASGLGANGTMDNLDRMQLLPAMLPLEPQSQSTAESFLPEQSQLFLPVSQSLEAEHDEDGRLNTTFLRSVLSAAFGAGLLDGACAGLDECGAADSACESGQEGEAGHSPDASMVNEGSAVQAAPKGCMGGSALPPWVVFGTKGKRTIGPRDRRVLLRGLVERVVAGDQVTLAGVKRAICRRSSPRKQTSADAKDDPSPPTEEESTFARTYHKALRRCAAMALKAMREAAPGNRPSHRGVASPPRPPGTLRLFGRACVDRHRAKAARCSARARGLGSEPRHRQRGDRFHARRRK
jgi:hypothetical protein